MFLCRREAHEPLAHICCTYTFATLIPLPLIHPQHSTALVPSQKRLCQTLSRALDHRNYLHREALFGSAVVTEQINGRKRSEKKLSLWQLHPCEQPLVHVWCLEEKCAGKRERCCATAAPAIRGDCPEGSKGMWLREWSCVSHHAHSNFSLQNSWVFALVVAVYKAQSL